MKIIEKIDKKELENMATNFFGDMVKAVVDIEKEIIAIDAELHSDLEEFLLSKGSKQRDLWGINFYPFLPKEDFVEFDSMINIKPHQNNMSRGIEDKEIQEKIIKIIENAKSAT